MTAATMTLGGPLSIACPTCRALSGRWCLTVRGRPSVRAHACHAARVKAAPPVEEVGAGDLVLVQLTPGRGAKHLLALLVEPGDTPLVRLWRGGPGAFASPRRVVRSVLLRRAPEEDPRVVLARAFLEELVPARPRVFDTIAHGRIWIVDADEAIVRWTSTNGGVTAGVIATTEWRRRALAGEIIVPTAPLASAPATRAIPPIPASVPKTAPKGW